MRSRIVPSAFGAVLLLGFAGVAWGSNEFCPVLTDRKASPEHSVVYKGKEVRFCCSECLKEFEDNPTLYLNQLPQFQDYTWRDEVVQFLTPDVRIIVCAILGVVLVGLMLLRRRWAARGTAPAGWLGRILTVRISPVFALAAVALFLGYEVLSLHQEIDRRNLEDHIHFATFHDFGYPPTPAKSKFERRVQATYYRGNDERSPKLHYGGKYRTATMHLSLHTPRHPLVRYGDQVPAEELFLRLEIVRAPHTPDFLYSDRLINRMFLTQQCDRFLAADGPVADRVNLTAVKPMQVWEALFPLGEVAAQGTDRKRGLIYFCEEVYLKVHWWSTQPSLIGSRFHYGIQYDLTFADGRLAAESDLWMGFLYRTRKVPGWRIDEWFSDKPIAELPYPNKTDDPVLLGLEDYRNY